MVLLFGGTTEAKQLSVLLDELDISYYYSTKTEVLFNGKGTSVFGALTKVQIESFCIQNNIKCIVNASHPFANILHQTIASISLDIPILRFERLFPIRIQHPLVSYVASFDALKSLLKEKSYRSLLALSGVQTIKELRDYWSRYRTWFRILDRDLSKSIATQLGFPSENLIYGFCKQFQQEVNLFKSLNPDVIFTKESGFNGNLDQKIKAALVTQIPIIILKRPVLSTRYICVNSPEEFTGVLISKIKFL